MEKNSDKWFDSTIQSSDGAGSPRLSSITIQCRREIIRWLIDGKFNQCMAKP